VINHFRQRSWKEAILVYRHPRVATMLFLGFSAGLPYLLVFSTLTAWLRDYGISRTAIGFFSWVGITYSIKVLWAPVVDRIGLGWLTRRLGQRRGWMLLAQLAIIVGLSGMALVDPTESLRPVVLLALLVAFGSATQDISVDAFRIEAIDDDRQGAMAASYLLGYRLALLAAGAGALHLAGTWDWAVAYGTMAALMLVGVVTVLVITEPAHRIDPETEDIESELVEKTEQAVHMSSRLRRAIDWFVAAVVAPFVEFFRRNQSQALWILLLIAVYRLSDITMGIMANPFYLDLGFDKHQIANVTKFFGFFMTIIGAGLGGVLVMRYGLKKPLMLGAVLVASTNLLFAWLATVGPDISGLMIVVSADNLSGGIANACFIAYLSSLTNRAYTATQYALFSSLMTLPGKFVAGFSGIAVDGYGYMPFFVGAAIVGIPAVLLSLRLLRQPD
jgi:PAT family beta-lactamase induction signal transducer AmpG